jgi:hypothetical protein
MQEWGEAIKPEIQAHIKEIKEKAKEKGIIL